jgi:hypothetical protein
VEEVAKKKKVDKLVFEAGQTLERCEAMGDLFAPSLTLQQKLPKLAPMAAEGPAGDETAAAAEAGKTTKKAPGKKAARKR